MVAWNRERIAALDDVKLANLRSNALDKNANSLVEMCDEELAARPVKLSRKRSSRSVGVDEQRNAEAEAAAQLTALAKSLQAQYDLTAATAKRMSAGIRGFRAVDLLGRSGSAKVGGMKLNGVLAIDLYISYRCKNDRASLGYVLLKGRPIEDARWVVTGTPNVLPGSKLIADQIAGLQELPGVFDGISGRVEEEFLDAAQIFEGTIRTIIQHNQSTSDEV